jgi:hypothetical protein
MFSSSWSLSIVVVSIFSMANLYVYANAAELETPLSGILGGDIDGVASNDNFGSAIATSSDGSRVVVGARNHDSTEEVTDSNGNSYFQNDVGSVRVFEYGASADPTGWSQLGGDIDGTTQNNCGSYCYDGEQFGAAVAMSADGNRIVVGAPYRHGAEQVSDPCNTGYTYYPSGVGTVRVFEYGTAANPTGWSQVGGEIDGVASNELFGTAVAMSADGNRIVVGNSPQNDDMSTSVRVYEYGTSASPTEWTQLGSALQSSETSYNHNYGNFEKNVAASSDCARVVVAFSKSTGYNEKVVRVFEYGTTTSPSDWTQIGTDMTAEVNEQFGSAVTMSADGDRIVIGARGGDVMGDAGNYFGTFNDVGFVRVMQYGTAANPSDWSQIGADVFGEAQNDQFGSSVALSGDGNRVAVGAPYNDPSAQEAGHVRVLVTACVEDAHVSEGTCRACAPGSTNEAGDVLTQVDTLCDVAYCAAYERVSNHTCVPCPVGSSNAPGDDPTGDDTECDYFQKSTTNSTNSCAAYEHVVSGACVPCPAGTLNAPGDDPTGDDTECDPLICGENYRVSSHGCLACETGDFNLAGDDASGEDTECDGFPSGWSDQGNYQGTNQPLVRSIDYSSATRSFRVGVAHFVVVALIVGSLEVIDYAYRFCVNIGCSEP